MFCQTCGGAINPGLSYCNHCGARISEPEVKLSEKSFGLLICALAVVPIVGIGLIMGLLVLLKKELGMADQFVFGVVLLSFLMLLASEAALFWLLASYFKIPKKKKGDIQSGQFELKNVKTKELTAPEGGGIYDSVPTVTEHTTRSLDAIPIQTKKQ